MIRIRGQYKGVTADDKRLAGVSRQASYSRPAPAQMAGKTSYPGCLAATLSL